MNERLKELLEQASEVHDYWYRGDSQRLVDHKMFAELIIQECLTTMLKESKWYWDKDEFESASAIQNAARRVREHFGVEE